MSRNSPSQVSTSSNTEDAANLKDETLPRWESNPEEDGDNKPFISIPFSDNDAFVENILVKSTQNIKEITITIINENNTEVSCFHGIVF